MQKLSIKLQNHSTSISLEPEFIVELKAIAKLENKSIAGIISDIDKTRLENPTTMNNFTNLSSTIRVFILNYIKSKK
ncbi:MAG: ribbon-helix-helix domain-containing protein [Rickettsiales bacterium]|jgi:predicted DNA-binding ribbon-helix-helix protein|nr:ribbon-helix-helix domain-containing protein [Rickettsiales bacterium]